MSGSHTGSCCSRCSQQRGSFKTGRNYFQVVALCAAVFSQAGCCWGFLMCPGGFEALFRAQDCAATGLGDGEEGTGPLQPARPLTLLCFALLRHRTEKRFSRHLRLLLRPPAFILLSLFSSAFLLSLQTPPGADGSVQLTRPGGMAPQTGGGWDVPSPRLGGQQPPRDPAAPAAHSSSLGNRNLKCHR